MAWDQPDPETLPREASLQSDIDRTVRQITAAIGRSEHRTAPYDYWLQSDLLPEDVLDGVLRLPFATPRGLDYVGTRERNNESRIYFSPENQRAEPVCAVIARSFKDPAVIAVIERTSKTDLSAGQLRIELCQDTDGFWLAPHVDLRVKLFSMIIYLSDDPALSDAGTDIFDDTPQHNFVASVPCQRNRSMFFIPGANTWHGFRKRPIRGVRKSLIVNYVSSEWRAREELA